MARLVEFFGQRVAVLEVLPGGAVDALLSAPPPDPDCAGLNGMPLSLGVAGLEIVGVRAVEVLWAMA